MVKNKSQLKKCGSFLSLMAYLWIYKSNIHCDWLDLYLVAFLHRLVRHAWVADRQDNQYAGSSSSEQWFVEMMHSEDLCIIIV